MLSTEERGGKVERTLSNEEKKRMIKNAQWGDSFIQPNKMIMTFEAEFFRSYGKSSELVQTFNKRMCTLIC